MPAVLSLGHGSQLLLCPGPHLAWVSHHTGCAVVANPKEGVGREVAAGRRSHASVNTGISKEHV